MATLKDMKMPKPKAQEEEDDLMEGLEDLDLEEDMEEEPEMGEDLMPTSQLLSALEDHGVSPELISQIEEQLGSDTEEVLEGEEEALEDEEAY